MTARLWDTPYSTSLMMNTNESPADSGQCWRRLFSNICVAEGFPVRARQTEEQGLEIPLDMMAELGGAKGLTVFRGELVIRGFETLFVPICKGDFGRHRFRES